MENLSTGKDYFLYFTKQLELLNDEELAECINNAVGIRAFGVSRQGYLWAIRHQLELRPIDYSAIESEGGISFQRKVYINNKKLHLLPKIK